MLSTFLARYDAQLLRPPAAATHPAPLPPHEAALQQRLLSWCRHGSGDGRGPAPEPLSAARLSGGPDDGQPCPLVEDLALRLDGSFTLLAAGGAWRQRLFRLRVKWDECRPWRPRAADAPWDSGYLITGTDLPARLARFQPRRPTLMVAQGLDDAGLQQALRSLGARRKALAQPVRLLVLAAAGSGPGRGGPLSFQPLPLPVDQ